jgi:hypothetical protein
MAHARPFIDEHSLPKAVGCKRVRRVTLRFRPALLHGRICAPSRVRRVTLRFRPALLRGGIFAPSRGRSWLLAGGWRREERTAGLGAPMVFRSERIPMRASRYKRYAGFGAGYRVFIFIMPRTNMRCFDLKRIVEYKRVRRDNAVGRGSRLPDALPSTFPSSRT